jgi:hypothetical protein
MDEGFGKTMENTTENVALEVTNKTADDLLVAERLFPAGETVEVTVAGHYLLQILASQDLEAEQVE